MSGGQYCILCQGEGHHTYDCPKRDGVCSMCGEPYRSYLDHLAECSTGD
jgi:hypothetical protein